MSADLCHFFIIHRSTGLNCVHSVIDLCFNVIKSQSIWFFMLTSTIFIPLVVTYSSGLWYKRFANKPSCWWISVSSWGKQGNQIPSRIQLCNLPRCPTTFSWWASQRVSMWNRSKANVTDLDPQSRMILILVWCSSLASSAAKTRQS